MSSTASRSLNPSTGDNLLGAVHDLLGIGERDVEHSGGDLIRSIGVRFAAPRYAQLDADAFDPGNTLGSYGSLVVCVGQQRGEISCVTEEAGHIEVVGARERGQ